MDEIKGTVSISLLDYGRLVEKSEKLKQIEKLIQNINIAYSFDGTRAYVELPEHETSNRLAKIISVF